MWPDRHAADHVVFLQTGRIPPKSCRVSTHLLRAVSAVLFSECSVGEAYRKRRVVLEETAAREHVVRAPQLKQQRLAALEDLDGPVPPVPATPRHPIGVDHPQDRPATARTGGLGAKPLLHRVASRGRGPDSRCRLLRLTSGWLVRDAVDSVGSRRHPDAQLPHEGMRVQRRPEPGGVGGSWTGEALQVDHGAGPEAEDPGPRTLAGCSG